MDFRLSEQANDDLRNPHTFVKNANVSREDLIVAFDYNPSDILGHEQGIGFCEWFLNELLKIKEINGSNFRHHVILLTALPNLDMDVGTESKEIEVTHELIEGIRQTEKTTADSIVEKYGYGAKLSVLMVTIYSAIRSRNDYFTKLSFSMNDAAWDEISDIL